MHDARDRNQGFYVGHGDALRFDVYSSVASLVVRLSGYFRGMDGEIRDIAIDVAPTSDRAISTGQQIIGAGFLLSLTASLLTGSANRGQCYVRASVRHGLTGQATPLAQLVGGYVTDDYMPSFPYGKIEGPLEGQGYLRLTSVPAPAVATGSDFIVPTGTRWRLSSYIITLTADANAANRELSLYINGSAGDDILLVPSGGNQTANQVVIYTFSPSGANVTGAQALWRSLTVPPVLIPAGSHIQTIITNVQAGDQQALSSLWTEEWIEA